MRRQCSICSAGIEAATLVNQLLQGGEFLKTIAEKTSFSKSSIHRHKVGRCEHGFVAWKAARLKAKREKVTGIGRRHVVRWFGLDGKDMIPERIVATEHSRFGSTCVDINPCDISADDLVIDCVFDSPKPPRHRPVDLLAPEPPSQPSSEPQTQD
jgi:hypothetical protein